jgi:hypothetical protein
MVFTVYSITFLKNVRIIIHELSTHLIMVRLLHNRNGRLYVDDDEAISA